MSRLNSWKAFRSARLGCTYKASCETPRFTAACTGSRRAEHCCCHLVGQALLPAAAFQAASARRLKAGGSQDWLPHTASFDLQYCRASNGVVLQGIDRTVRIFQTKNLRGDANRNLGRHAQEVMSILTRVIGHAPDHTLLVEQIVVQRRNCAHMNAAQR